MAKDDFAALGRAIIDANLYMVLGTADEEGRPWVSPVYFAHSGFREFFWVSRPERKHSQNLVRRPELGVVIFDSQVPIGTGRAVYLWGSAEQLAAGELLRAVDVFSRRSLEHGGESWTLDDVQAPAQLRLYRATASEQYVLDSNDERVPVSL